MNGHLGNFLILNRIKLLNRLEHSLTKIQAFRNVHMQDSKPCSSVYDLTLTLIFLSVFIKNTFNIK